MLIRVLTSYFGETEHGLELLYCRQESSWHSGQLFQPKQEQKQIVQRWVYLEDIPTKGISRVPT